MRDLKPKLLIICMLVGCLVAAGTTKATEKVTITVSEDAHVGDTFPNSNFGSSTNLYVGDVYQNDPIQSWRSYLKFDLSSIPSSTVMIPSGRRTGTVVTSARLYVGHSGTGGGPPDIIVEAHYCDDDSWTEYGITWNNAPAYDGSCTDRHKLPRYESCCNCWCLTEDVQTAIDEDGILSVVFDCTGEGYDHRWATLDSRENTWTYAPYLVVEYEEGDRADPNVKWEQLPALEPYGMDIDMSQTPLADDFNCAETGPIEVIRIWGSFFNDQLPEDGVGSLSFRLRFFDNIPAMTPEDWSKPGMELWSKDFEPGEYTVKKVYEGPEDWYNPIEGIWYNDDHSDAYQYTFYIDPIEAFEQQGDPWDPVIYWLGVEDITPPEGYKFGWKTAIFPWWGDDGVYWDEMSGWLPLKYPPEHEFQYDSIDLAFAIVGHTEAGMDLGDAPDSSNSHNDDMEAYPGVRANYPTVYTAGSPPYGPLHWQPKAVAYLGNNVSLEVEADIGPDDDPNNNIDPPNDNPNQDGYDDGVDVPLNLPCCRWTTFEYDVNVVNVNVDLYVNVWFDFNRDGDFDDSSDCNNVSAPEWAVQNQLLVNLHTGLNTITTPGFVSWHPEDGPEEIWMRITLSEQAWRGGDGPVLVHRYSFTDGDTTAVDSVNGQNGTLENGASISGDQVQLDGEDDYVDLPGSAIDIDTFSAVTLEMWSTQPEINQWWSMTAALGSTWGNGTGRDYIMIATSRDDDVSRGAIANTPDQDEPWNDEVYVNGPELNDGLEHHYVLTISDTELAYYIDGELQGTAPMGGTTISEISNDFAYLGKSVYTGDDTMECSINEFRIYNSVLSPEEISQHYDYGPDLIGYGGSGPQNGYEYGETEDYYFKPDTSCSEDPDLNCDGKVNFKDVAILANEWLRGT